MTEPERLHKFIARCGVTSRRKAEEYIVEGRVTVNGEIVRELGIKVSPTDEVMVDGLVLTVPDLYYVLLNKPTNVLTTMEDPRHRRTILHFLPDVGIPLKPVGRLDYQSEGLLICTNDGELAARLTHPRYGIEKEYQVTVTGTISPDAADRLARGVMVEGKMTAPAQVIVGHVGTEQSSFRITIHEGRNRQIRKMCDALGLPVVGLRRIRIGTLTIRKMPAGMARTLSQSEVKELMRIAGLVPGESGPAVTKPPIKPPSATMRPPSKNTTKRPTTRTPRDPKPKPRTKRGLPIQKKTRGRPKGK